MSPIFWSTETRGRLGSSRWCENNHLCVVSLVVCCAGSISYVNPVSGVYIFNFILFLFSWHWVHILEGVPSAVSQEEDRWLWLVFRCQLKVVLSTSCTAVACRKSHFLFLPHFHDVRSSFRCQLMRRFVFSVRLSWSLSHFLCNRYNASRILLGINFIVASSIVKLLYRRHMIILRFYAL